MHWERSNVIGLAKASCSFCHGYGMRPVLRGTEAPCNCVFRAVFRACYQRFRECVALGTHTNAITWDRCGGPSGYRAYSRKREEFMADFCLVSRRTLDDFEYRVFRSHFLLGGDWKICCRQLNIDRGTFFHHIYNIEDRLGRVFAELSPYSLYPVSEYFAGTTRREVSRAAVTGMVRRAESPRRALLPLSA
jgi:hypothetical protein